MVEARNHSIQWLRRNISVRFWLRFRALLDAGDWQHRAQLEVTNAFAGFQPNKSLLKNLSHLGAVRVPQGASLGRGHLLFEDEVHLYLDPTNAVYKKVWVAAWPEGPDLLGISAEETIGDLVEAFLGFHWHRVIMGRKAISGLPNYFVQVLEAALFWSYFSIWD